MNKEIRRILTEDQARDWFKTFGPINNKGFDEIFDADLGKGTSENYAFIVEEGIMFVKLKEVWYDIFGSTPQEAVVMRYMIIPHITDYT